MTIVVADLDPVVERTVRAQCAGRVIVALSGEDAMSLARAQARELDLVVVGMDMDLELRRITALLREVPVIACGASEEIASAFAAGAHDFVARPIREGELVVRIHAALRIRRQRRTAHEQQARMLTWTRQLEKVNRQLESTACVDPLTGVANRRHFDNLLATEWRRAQRDGSSLAIALFDLDEFHAYNTRYGHIGGDRCLQHVASVLAHELRRASDVVARYGGEELVAVLPETDIRGAIVVAERLRMRIERLALPHAAATGRQIVTTSVGVAACTPSHGGTAALLVASADVALYRAKHDGRNCTRADGARPDDIVITEQPWPTCPVLILDPVLVQRVPPLLESVEREIAGALEAVRRDELEPAQSLVARLDRVGTELGFAALVDASAQLGDALREQHVEGVARALGDAAWQVEHVRVVYRRPPQLRAV